MSRTTELIKEIKSLKKQFVKEDNVKDACDQNLDVLRRINLRKYELKGRLDVLKDEEKFLKQYDYQHRHFTNPKSKQIQKELIERLSQIQKEIKEIEKS
jgi:hypothetical protein